MRADHCDMDSRGKGYGKRRARVKFDGDANNNALRLGRQIDLNPLFAQHQKSTHVKNTSLKNQVDTPRSEDYFYSDEELYTIVYSQEETSDSMDTVVPHSVMMEETNSALSCDYEDYLFASNYRKAPGKDEESCESTNDDTSETVESDISQTVASSPNSASRAPREPYFHRADSGIQFTTPKPANVELRQPTAPSTNTQIASSMEHRRPIARSTQTPPLPHDALKVNDNVMSTSADEPSFERQIELNSSPLSPSRIRSTAEQNPHRIAAPNVPMVESPTYSPLGEFASGYQAHTTRFPDSRVSAVDREYSSPLIASPRRPAPPFMPTKLKSVAQPVALDGVQMNSDFTRGPMNRTSGHHLTTKSQPLSDFISQEFISQLRRCVNPITPLQFGLAPRSTPTPRPLPPPPPPPPPVLSSFLSKPFSESMTTHLQQAERRAAQIRAEKDCMSVNGLLRHARITSMVLPFSDHANASGHARAASMVSPFTLKHNNAVNTHPNHTRIASTVVASTNRPVTPKTGTHSHRVAETSPLIQAHKVVAPSHTRMISSVRQMAGTPLMTPVAVHRRYPSSVIHNDAQSSAAKCAIPSNPFPTVTSHSQKLPMMKLHSVTTANATTPSMDYPDSFTHELQQPSAIPKATGAVEPTPQHSKGTDITLSKRAVSPSLTTPDETHITEGQQRRQMMKNKMVHKDGLTTEVPPNLQLLTIVGNDDNKSHVTSSLSMEASITNTASDLHSNHPEIIDDESVALAEESVDEDDIQRSVSKTEPTVNIALNMTRLISSSSSSSNETTPQPAPSRKKQSKKRESKYVYDGYAHKYPKLPLNEQPLATQDTAHAISACTCNPHNLGMQPIAVHDHGSCCLPLSHSLGASEGYSPGGPLCGTPKIVGRLPGWLRRQFTRSPSPQTSKQFEGQGYFQQPPRNHQYHHNRQWHHHQPPRSQQSQYKSSYSAPNAPLPGSATLIYDDYQIVVPVSEVEKFL